MLPIPNTILNLSVSQSELLKIFHSHQLQAPKTAGPDAEAPIASPLMQRWAMTSVFGYICGTATRTFITRTYQVCLIFSKILLGRL